MKPIDDPKFRQSAMHFRDAVEASKRHHDLANEALEKYGDHGPQISGVIRDHFPAALKEELRTLARDVTRHLDLAWKARPKGTRNSTMRRLSSQTADRYGTGFYGPSPSGPTKLPSHIWGKNPMSRLDFRVLDQIIQGMDGASRAEFENALKTANEFASDMAVPASKRALWKKLAAMLRAEIKKFGRKGNPSRRENPKSVGDAVAARELALYIENANYVTPHGDSAATGRHVRDVIANLRKKYKKGIYKPELAVKLWKYVADTAAKDYSRSYSSGDDGYGIFTAETRRMAAEIVEPGFREMIEMDEKENPVRRKKRRSAKQIAATRKLVAMNKKRRSNPVHRKAKIASTSPRSRYFSVFRATQGLPHNYVLWLVMRGKQLGWTITRGDALRFESQERARKVAERLPKKLVGPIDKLGVASNRTTEKALKKFCAGKA